ncbi:PulJ/GspJ family protein [Gudongella sp. SC589]|uniref:PulJ/GspJ family protein n=1 Tax=Gudongella sp. SC589 TaxID=3385990 RepID=UPI003904D296
MKNKKKGVTLIELIITLAIISILITIAFSFFSFSNKTYVRGNDQFDVQSEARLAIDYLTNRLRFATDIEMLSTIPTIDATDEYNYMFISNLDSTLTHSEYNSGNARNVTKLGSNIDTSSYFTSKALNGNQIIEFNIIAMDDKGTDFNLVTEISLPNINLDYSNKKTADTSIDDGIIGIKYKRDYNIAVEVSDDGDGEDDSENPPDENDEEETTPTDEYLDVYVSVTKQNKNSSLTITLQRVSTGTLSSNYSVIENSDTTYKVAFYNVHSVEDSVQVVYKYTIKNNTNNKIIKEGEFTPSNNPEINYTE